MAEVEEEFSVEKVKKYLLTLFCNSLLQVTDKRVGRNGKTEYLLKWGVYGDEVGAISV